ncbi:hypothetical protein ABBQ38_003904 [Trebouxia sp. C0009 RCD-2024]
MQSLGCPGSVSYLQSRLTTHRSSGSIYGRKGCSTRGTGSKRTVSQLEQSSSTPAATADAASRLSAAAQHTIHDLVASTSDAEPDASGLTARRVGSAISEALQQLGSSLPAQGLLPSSSAEAPLPPHYGTQAVVKAFQTALAASNKQLFGSQTVTLPNITGARQTVEAAYAAALSQGAAALSTAAAPANQLTASLTSQLTAGDGQHTLEPHYGSHAASAAAAQLSHSLSAQLTSLSGSSQSSTPSFRSTVDSLQQTINALQSQGKTGTDLLQLATNTLEVMKESLSHVLPGSAFPAVGDFSQLQTFYSTILTQLQSQARGGYSSTTIAIIAAAVVVAVTASLPNSSWGMPDPLDTLPWEWNAASVAGYWSRRPVAVARRSAAVTIAGLTVGIGLLLDRAAGKLGTNSPKRAAQVRKIIERLGPAYVKVAQAVSTRVDLLDANYLREIERLQDRVPPFPTKAALPVMTEAFGRPVDEVFSSLSVEPVASASLGQVYKGRVRDMYGGGEVAVKVQRPHVQASVALDLHLMRRFAEFCQTFPQVRTNWVGLIDEWATRFFHELDYEREAQNGMTFKEQMAGLDGIVVADVYQDLSNKEVLTTVWVQGEKLSESTAGDVRELCTTLLNCYLIQLLETGFLHADPHPGNLIRTPQGQICILDFGLMTEVTPEQSLALVEYIAHLSVEDWDGIARDLRKLGFVPADAPEMAELGLVEPLGNILSQLSQGGGAKGINIDAVTIALDELSRDYPIDIPPYFALILRAFSVIEGIALRVDPDYAIVKETFPYLSRRLLTDDQPRARAALRQLLYGNKARLDITRLQRLGSGFGNFTTSGIRSTQPAAAANPPALDDTSKEILRMVFDRNGSYLQELLVDELVAGADAVAREGISELCRTVLGTPPALATFGTLQALGPLRILLAPFPTPFEVLYSLQPAVAPNAEDQEALLTVRGIWSLLQPNLSLQRDSQQSQQVWDEIYPLVPELLPGLGLTVEMFGRQLLARVALRLAEELQRPPRRFDQPGSITGSGRPQYDGYDGQI